MQLSPQQKALLYCGLHQDDNALVSYTLSSDGCKSLSKAIRDASEQALALSSFQKDPKNFLAYCRQGLFQIVKDSGLSEAKKQERLERYIREHLSLTLKLDAEAFPHNIHKIYDGIPKYVPDGLSDMGSDGEIETHLRSGREKIHVNKKAIFDKAFGLFIEIFQNPQMTKRMIIEKVAEWVYINFPYDYRDSGDSFGPRTVTIEEIMRAQKAVCRHHALITQVLNQAFGLTSRLLKCDLDGGAHACNLVRIDNIWYLLDSTNPKIEPVKKHLSVFLEKIPETSIDLNAQAYQWLLTDGKRKRNYKSRNNMRYRIK